MKYLEFIGYLSDIGIEYKTDVTLKDYTTFKIGGNCPVMAIPHDTKQVSEIIKSCNKFDLEFIVIGRGSNLLISDNGIDKVVIYIGEKFSNIKVSENNVEAQAGASLTKICNTVLEFSLSGIEFAYGIPGTVGGALYMNAGAYGGEMKDIVTGCEYVDSDGNICNISSSDKLNLEYRHSFFTDKNYCITAVFMKLVFSDKNEIKSKMDDLMKRRRDKQPLEYPSAGSTFKRPEGNYASALIDQCGLKGLSVGGAMVSTKHSGFVINTGDATCSDVLLLIDEIKKTVKEKTGYDLFCEVKII